VGARVSTQLRRVQLHAEKEAKLTAGPTLGPPLHPGESAALAPLRIDSYTAALAPLRFDIYTASLPSFSVVLITYVCIICMIHRDHIIHTVLYQGTVPGRVVHLNSLYYVHHIRVQSIQHVHYEYKHTALRELILIPTECAITV
jgi:hypothetical protein